MYIYSFYFEELNTKNPCQSALSGSVGVGSSDLTDSVLVKKHT